VAANVKAFLDAMRAEWEFLPAHYVTSVVKILGREKILGFIGDANEAWKKAVNS
jgi:GTP-binding protein